MRWKVFVEPHCIAQQLVQIENITKQCGGKYVNYFVFSFSNRKSTENCQNSSFSAVRLLLCKQNVEVKLTLDDTTSAPCRTASATVVHKSQ